MRRNTEFCRVTSAAQKEQGVHEQGCPCPPLTCCSSSSSSSSLDSFSAQDILDAFFSCVVLLLLAMFGELIENRRNGEYAMECRVVESWYVI
jgi:hypothetical protein